MLKSQNVISSEVYTFSKDLSNLGAVNMRIGGENLANLKPGSTFEVGLISKATNWAVNLEEIYMNGKHLKLTKDLDKMVVDPTSVYVTFPVDAYDKVCEGIKESDHRFDKKLSRHCQTKVHGQCSADLPTIQLRMVGG